MKSKEPKTVAEILKDVPNQASGAMASISVGIVFSTAYLAAPKIPAFEFIYYACIGMILVGIWSIRGVVKSFKEALILLSEKKP